MGEFVEVAGVNDLQEGQSKVVEAKGKKIALFKRGGKFFAIDNTCLHAGGPLGEGQLADNIVTCPWHGWQYDVTTGENQYDKSMKVAKYETKIEEDKVKVSVD